MRIYIESTIPSYVAARPARDILQAARQQLTIDWWNSRRVDHELFISQVVLASELLPREADRDAAHISFGTVHGMDILLSWNCRHIANAAIQARLRRLAESAGWTLPVICTPEELLGDSHD